MHCCLERRDNLKTVKEKKKRTVDELSQRVERAKSFVLTDFQGLTVAEISELRRALKEVGCEYKVCKNTLLWIALGEASFKEEIKDSLRGSTGIVFGYDDPVIPIKKALEFSEKNQKLKLKKGVVEGKVYSPQELKELAKLPSKNVLFSMLLGGMTATVAKMAYALKAINLRFLYALESLKNKKIQ